MPIESGQNLLHYTLVAKIGEGGMGAVWQATDTTLNRDVAIKLLPKNFAEDPDRLARFEREAKLLASLNHPNIAAVYGSHHADTSDGPVRFLVMELVEGEDLSKRLERGALPVERALEIGAQMAAGIEAAHDKGVVHRDLKPANVIVAPDGRVRLLDFGLAKAFEADPAGSDPLWVREIDRFEAQPLDGTEDAKFAFWSPDGRHLGFFAGGRLKRLEVASGRIQSIGGEGAFGPRGASWSSSGQILFAPNSNTGISFWPLFSTLPVFGRAPLNSCSR